MADKKKGKSGDKGTAKPAEAKAEAAKVEAKAEAAKVEAEKAEHADHEEHEDGAHGHDHGHAPAHGGGHAHAHKPNIKEYLVIFGLLAFLTVLEVGVAKIPGVSKGLMGLALVGLALTKAGIVALYYMHLKSETRVLKMTVALPMAAPTIYAVVLISEAAWRYLRG